MRNPSPVVTLGVIFNNPMKSSKSVVGGIICLKGTQIFAELNQFCDFLHLGLSNLRVVECVLRIHSSAAERDYFTMCCS